MCFSIFDLKKKYHSSYLCGPKTYIMNPKFLSIHWSIHFIGFIHFHWQVTGVHGMPGPDGHLFMRQGSDVCRALWLLRVPRRLHVQQNGLFESRFVKKRNGTSPQPGGFQPELELELHSVSLFEGCGQQKDGPLKNLSKSANQKRDSGSTIVNTSAPVNTFPLTNGVH